MSRAAPASTAAWRPSSSAPSAPGQVDAAPALGRLAFWLVMLFVLVAFFQQLSLTLVTRPLDSLLTLVFAYIPLLIGAGVLLLVAWIIATRPAHALAARLCRPCASTSA